MENPDLQHSATPLWWQTGVIYQIYPRSFQDTNSDGVGDLAGVIQRLDYLSALGVDAIWLSPFYRSPMADFGYDISDHIDVDPLFGDLTTFDRLLAEAHQREIRVIVDYVPNHTSDQHPWFIESRSARNSEKRDWYIWRDARPDGGPPNNWLSLFGGSAWEWDPHTGQYYLHTFLKEQPDLNWRNTLVQNAMFDVARFWLDRGVDGFRIDVAAAIMKDPELRDNPVNPEPRRSRFGTEWDQYLHIHSYRHPEIHGIYRDFRRLLDSYGSERPRMSIGEVDYEDMEKWIRYYGESLDELHMPFGFHLLHARWQSDNVRRIVDTVEGNLPEGAWPNWVLGNHDEPRIATRVGLRQARVAMMLLLTLRGTPTIYYGDELGMQNVHIPSEQARDPWGKNVAELGRDAERTPMQWDAGPNAGFCPSGSAPWLPIADDYKLRNVAAELENPRSLLCLTRELTRTRRSSPALQLGGYRSIDASADCFAYIRQVEDQTLLVLLNFANGARPISLPHLGSGRLLVSTELDSRGPVDLSSIELRPNEGWLVQI